MSFRQVVEFWNWRRMLNYLFTFLFSAGSKRRANHCMQVLKWNHPNIPKYWRCPKMHFTASLKKYNIKNHLTFNINFNIQLSKWHDPHKSEKLSEINQPLAEIPLFQLASVHTYVLVLSKHSSLEHLSRNLFWNGLPYLIQPQTAATMSVSSMSDLDNEAAPKKTSFGDAASKMGGGNINSVAMITKSLVKVCTDCLTNVVCMSQIRRQMGLGTYL